jgi:hypothetical protein
MKQKALCMWIIVALLIGGIAIPAHAGEAPAPRSPVDGPYQAQNESVGSYYGMSDYRSNPPGELLIADALILRPLGLVSCAIGVVSTMFITSPWACSSNSHDRVQAELIDKPFGYTFKRKLGDLDY